MQPRIQRISTKMLIGKRLKMSLSNDLTGSLWGSFMPFRSEIRNSLDDALYSVQLYGPGYFDDFNPASEFEKWAAVEVPDFDSVPIGMEKLCLPEGLYAVFEYQGRGGDSAIFQYIFTSWLPNSKYNLDCRPHFEVLGQKYKNGDPNSEEEIWVPVKPAGV